MNMFFRMIFEMLPLKMVVKRENMETFCMISIGMCIIGLYTRSRMSPAI